jgi:hypothetical protein
MSQISVSRRIVFLALCVVTLGLYGFSVLAKPKVLDLGYAWIGQRTATKRQLWKNIDNQPVTLDLPPALKGPFYYSGLQMAPGVLKPGGVYGVGFVGIPDRAGPITQEWVPLNLQGLSVQPALLKMVGLSRLERGGLTLGGGYIHALPGTPAGGASPNGGPNNGPLDFGIVLVKHHGERTITIQNSTPNPLQLNVLWQPWGRVNPFSVSLSTGGAARQTLQIGANSSLTIILSFSPPEDEIYETNLFIQDSAALKDTETSKFVAALSLKGTGKKPDQ